MNSINSIFTKPFRNNKNHMLNINLFKKTMKKIILYFSFLLFAIHASASSEKLSELPELFKQAIPEKLKNGLMLVELNNRCEGCTPWRAIDFYSNTSPEPIRKGIVSVIAGYRAMYAYPGTHYFANIKIEQSAPDRFETDEKIIEDALRHEFNRKKELVQNYFSSNPDVKKRADSERLKGKDYIELEDGERNGIKYIFYTENVIGLTGGVISQIHFFIPEKRITITAYLLKQQKSKFKNIEEFRKLQDEFIDQYTGFLARKS